MTDEQLAIRKIFMPHAMRELSKARRDNRRFAHYTSAETGLKILRSERIFLRNSSLMNDFSEIHHGWNCLLSAYNSAVGMRLQTAIRGIQQDLPEILQNNFNGIIPDVMNETYLTSVSEHGDLEKEVTDIEHEDRYGRLSMWRAYAPKNGVAFVMNNTPFLSESNALGAFTSPVVYATPETFQPAFEEMVCAVETNLELIKPLGGLAVHNLLMDTFRIAVQSTKHPSFREEREWRIIYSPLVLHRQNALTDTQLARVPSEIISLSGVPQRIFSIPFIDYPEENFVGASPIDLINRVLIGPSRDSSAIRHAYVSELLRLNVVDAESKVFITGVPLRH